VQRKQVVTQKGIQVLTATAFIANPAAKAGQD
jgi:hypothetical protein